MAATDLAQLLIDDPDLRSRALRAPGAIVAEWCLSSATLTEAGHRLSALTADVQIRREGHAALFSLLAAAVQGSNP